MNELEHIEQTIDRAMRTAWYETGIHYARIKQEDLYLTNGWDTWAEYCDGRWNRTPQSLDMQIARSRELGEMVKIFTISEDKLPATMSQATELSKLKSAEERAVVWQRVLNTANGSGITALMVKGEVERYEAEKAKDWITLEEWTALDPDRQTELLSQVYGDNKQFNKQDGDNIEWARWSWNPITGCLHNCPYCYARDIADRFYPQGFQPTIIPGRLNAPQNTSAPDISKFKDNVDRIGWRNVFTCSMADLFGKWVPDEWILAVLKQAADNPQWNFLFLTKFPIRMAEFEYPPNTWIGTTVDSQYAVERAEKGFRKVRASGYQGVAWLSCEPMMECLTFSSLDMFDWVVMGGASKSNETPAFAPPQRWISHLVAQADACDLPIYQKTNLIQKNGIGVDFDGRIREYPV
jgi:protein gp37